MKKRRRIFRIIAIIIASCIVIFVLAFCGLRIIYPAILRANHKIEAPGIDLMEMVEIGGIQQALYFRGENVENPVILFLHGGPGRPQIPFIHDYQYDWERDFTIVNWDQRNAGKTYFANDPDVVRDTMNAERVLADAHEVTLYIMQKLNKDKIIVMGHSWGSVLGTMLVQTYPENYSAYIGVGQVVNMTDNERVGYEKLMEVARAEGNQKDIAAIEAFAPWPQRYDEKFNETMMKFRGYQAKYKLAAGMSLDLVRTVLTSPYYTFGEITYFFTVDGLYYQGDVMRFMMEDFDVRIYGVTYEMPVYYIMGENDWQTPYVLANEFFSEIYAPDKEFYLIPDAGHFTQLDNKVEFNRVLLEEIKLRIQ